MEELEKATVTVGLKLATDAKAWWHMLPFVGLSLLLSLPALCVLARWTDPAKYGS